MSATIILVKWRGSKETITIDLAALKKGKKITATTELFAGDPRPYLYETDSTFEPDGKGGGTLVVFYRARKNKPLKGLGCRWGKSMFHLNDALDNGQVEWHDNNEEYDRKGRPTYSGPATWERFAGGESFLGKKERETVERIARQQARFRKRLLMIDPRCAITGEREPCLLEAAHVVPAASNGSDIERNGLMLRVDLHRLFDANLFSINKQGGVSISKDLTSEHYVALLRKHSTISGETFARIKDAWKVKNKRVSK